MNVLQEHYKLKKRISVLEEELMMDGEITFQKNPVNEIIRNQVLSLYKQGVNVDQITKQSTLSRGEVLSILKEA